MTIAPIAALGTAWIVTLVILAILIIALVIVGVWGNKLQKKSAAAQQQLQAAAQPMTLLVIDKKRMKISEANLPKVVIDNVPKMMRRSKVPIVKAKVGPRIMTFMCDEKVFDMIPVKQEIRAMVGGIYILSVKSFYDPCFCKPAGHPEAAAEHLRYRGCGCPADRPGGVLRAMPERANCKSDVLIAMPDSLRAVRRCVFTAR